MFYKTLFLSSLAIFGSLNSFGQKPYTAKTNPILTDCQDCYHSINHDTAFIGARFHYTDIMTDKDKDDLSRHYLVSYEITNPEIDEEENRHICIACEEFHLTIWRDLVGSATYFQIRFWINDAYSTGEKTIYHSKPKNNFISIQYTDGTKDILYDLNVYKSMFLVKPNSNQLKNLKTKKIKQITCSNDASTFINTSIHKIGDTCAAYIKDVVKAYASLGIGTQNQSPTKSANQIEAKFASLINNEGIITLNFKKSDGTTISFIHNFMKDSELGYNFLDENGNSNEALIGESFLIQWEEQKVENDGTGSVELINKILIIKQL